MKETSTPAPMVPVNAMPKSQLLLIGLLLVAAFFMGNLYTKVQYLEKNSAPAAGNPQPAAAGQPAPVSKYKTFDEAMEAMAKNAKVDSKKLITCMNSGEKKAVVDADVAQGNTAGVNGTPAFFINGRLIPGAVPFEEFKKVIDEELNGTADKTIQRVTVDIGNAPTIGTKGAPITIVEFSDFQCPFCGRAFPTVNQVMEEYKGKVLLAFKHFPLISIHPRAQKSSEAAICAGDQGKFWEFHDALFEFQTDWSSV